MNRRARQRFKIVLAMVLCLLFQQAALAAYLCPIEQMPAEPAAMAAHCAEMGMKQAQDNPALCEKHCNPDHTLGADAAKLAVPPLALPAIVLAPIDVQMRRGMVDIETPIARSDPPPRLRFCSLLI